MYNEGSIRVALGKTCLEISCQDREFMEKAGQDYRPFIVSGQPDFRIRFNLRNVMAASEVRELLRNSRSHLEGNRYFTKPELLECLIDWKEATVCINAERNLFAPEADYKFMNMLLRGIYWGIYKKVWNTSPEAYLIHGCGLVDSGRGYLFAGPSGSGKTTIARLSDGRRVLNDETVIIGKDQEGFYMAGTPFDGGVPERCGNMAHLSAIFFLKHAAEVSVRRLDAVEAYRRFLVQILHTAPLFEPPRLEFLSEQADLSNEVTSRTASYELGFRPDSSFWEVIKDVRGV